MIDKIDKAINKLQDKEGYKIKLILNKLKKSDFNNLDIKKLTNREDIFRVRKGQLRIIFYKKDKDICILSVERRSNNTYSK